MTRVIAIIQARMGSATFPGKSLPGGGEVDPTAPLFVTT